ncbi:hypothetical protein CR513_24849, partial [Mucuna pruriens]
MGVITLRSGKELPQQQKVNLHSEFPNFDDFIDYDCTCTGLTEFPICTKGARVVDIVGSNITRVVKVVEVQPPLPSIVQPLHPLSKQEERLLQEEEAIEAAEPHHS